MTDTAVLLCGHGSRDPEAISEFELAAAALRPRLPEFDFSTGYLEFARPTIRDGLTLLAARGARRILAIPGMLFAASHVKNDLPWEVNSFIADHPEVDVRLARDLGIDPRLLGAAADRIAAAADPRIPRSETLLLVVGRGTNDPDANSNISKLARMLWEGMGLGWAEAAFSGVAHPRVDAALERSQRRPTGNWYTFAASRAVQAGRPLGTRVAGVELVAWRDHGSRLRVGPRGCPHLGADLATANSAQVKRPDAYRKLADAICAGDPAGANKAAHDLLERANATVMAVLDSPRDRR